MKEAGSGRITFVKNSELKKGFKLIGTYRKLTVNKKFGNKEYHIKQGETTFILNGSGKLNKLFEEVSLGSQVELHYQGKKMIEKGQWEGTKAHDWKLLYDTNAETQVASEDLTSVIDTDEDASEDSSDELPF